MPFLWRIIIRVIGNSIVYCLLFIVSLLLKRRRAEQRIIISTSSNNYDGLFKNYRNTGRRFHSIAGLANALKFSGEHFAEFLYVPIVQVLYRTTIQTVCRKEKYPWLNKNACGMWNQSIFEMTFWHHAISINKFKIHSFIFWGRSLIGKFVEASWKLFISSK